MTKTDREYAILTS